MFGTPVLALGNLVHAFERLFQVFEIPVLAFGSRAATFGSLFLAFGSLAIAFESFLLAFGNLIQVFENHFLAFGNYLLLLERDDLLQEISLPAREIIHLTIDKEDLVANSNILKAKNRFTQRKIREFESFY